jgi:hypothetical protein
LPKNDESPPTHKSRTRMSAMSRSERSVQKIWEEFAKFEKTMEELHMLKIVAEDLKNFRKMIKLKRYD